MVFGSLNRLGLETVHQHDRVAELDRDRREVQHRRVVERRAAQVHVVVEGRQRENPEEPGGGPRHLVRILAGQRAAWTEKDMAEVAARSRAAALANPRAQVSGEVTADDLLARPYVAEPLRAHDCAPVGDGATVVMMASAERARDLCARPAWITGFAHRIDSGSLGARDLLAVPSAAAAARAAGVGSVRATAGVAPVEVAPVEVAPVEEPSRGSRVARAVHPSGDPAARGARARRRVVVNPSGGALCGNPMFAAGLARIGMAAQAVMSGQAQRALGHATSGPALQQNLVCVLEAQ